MNSFHIRATRAEAHDAIDLVRPYAGQNVYIRGEYVNEWTEAEHLLVRVGLAPEGDWAGHCWTYVSADEWLKQFDAHNS